MQRQIFLLLMVVFWALASKGENFTYTFEGQTLTYTVIDETARTVATNAGTSYNNPGNLISGTLVLPANPVDMERNVEYTLTKVSDYSFSRCVALTSVTIPNTVTSIGNNAFIGCSGLQVASLQPGLDVIGNSAFYGCTKLTMIDVPNSVRIIDASAFYGCSGLESVTMPESLIYVGVNAFYGCTSLKKANFASIEGLCAIQFQSAYSNPLFLAGNLYVGDKEVKELCPTDAISVIGKYAFAGCTGLTSVMFPESAIQIGERAFVNCSGLTSIRIPTGMCSIGEAAFIGCKNLKEVDYSAYDCSCAGYYSVFPSTIERVIIGKYVKAISQYAFNGCSKLSELIIPDSVENIGRLAFGAADGIRKLQVNASTPPVVSADAFATAIYSSAELCVPASSLSLYQEAPVWQKFKKIIGSQGVVAIDEIVAESVSVEVVGGAVIVNGATRVKVYSVSGTEVYSGASGRLGLPAGTYIVVADSLTKKIRI